MFDEESILAPGPLECNSDAGGARLWAAGVWRHGRSDPGEPRAARTLPGIRSSKRHGASTMNISNRQKNPGTAAVLSLVVPGVGQIYNGDFLRGIFWLIITPGFWIGTGGLLGWVCHVLAAMTAHHRARLKNQALA
jgi:hypothetical protein